MIPVPRFGLARALAAGALLTATFCAGCDGGPTDMNPLPATPTSKPDFSMPFTSTSPANQLPDPDQVTPQVAKQLCDMMNPEIDTWRTQGPVLGRVSFNATVHDWAARSGGLNDRVVADRAVVDRITTQQCPEVRTRVLDALQITELADGLAGFGR